MVAFTICCNNYFARAMALAESFLQLNDEDCFYLIISDINQPSINYPQNEKIKTRFIEEIEPNYNELIEKYCTVELATSIKASACIYLLKENEQIVYFDPDIYLYSKMDELKEMFVENDIILTPHILTPIKIDNKTPSEIPFQQVGVFNLGFIALKRTVNSKAFLVWWKERLLNLCYIDVGNGLFTDQIFITHVPIFFDKVLIIKDFGYNMAPWNLHERFLTKKGDKYLVNDIYELKFYHFSSYKLNSLELPIEKYDRFNIRGRNDLLEIYQKYNNQLLKFKDFNYSTLTPQFEKVRILKIQSEFSKKSFHRRLFWGLIRKIPKKIRLKTIYFLNKSFSN